MAAGVTVRSINIDVKVDAKSAIAQLERLEKALDGIKKASLGVDNMKKQIGAIKKEIAGIAKSTASAAKGLADVAKATNETSKANGSMTKNAKKAKTSLADLKKTIGKLLLYRTIRQALMLIGNSFRKGLEYVKEYSNAVKGSQFSEMFSSYTEMGTTLKASFGASFASVLEVIEPVLSGLTFILSEASNAVTQFFAALTNDGKYMKVNTEYIKKYSNALKEAKNQIMGFDEINKLNNTDIDYSQLYYEENVSDGMVALGAAITSVLAIIAGWSASNFVKKLINVKNAVKDVTTAVENKNTQLTNESKELDTDAQKAGALSGALIGVGGLLPAITALIDYLKLNPISIDTKEPVTSADDLSEAIDGITTSYQTMMDTLKKYGAPKIDTEDAETAVSDLTTSIEGVGDAISELQKYLDENPIRIGIKVGDEDTEPSAADGAADAVKSISDATLAFKEAALDPGSAVSSYDSSKDDVWNWQHGLLGSSAESSESQLEMPDFMKNIAAKILADNLEDIADGTIFNPAAKIGQYISGNETAQEVIKAVFEGIASGVRSFSSVFGFGTVKGYASGGYPSAGSMFIAGEAGPEIVGSINGRTGVASGDEVTGIRTAVYSIGEAIVDAINNKDTNAVVRLDDGSIYKASQRGAKRVGNSLISFAN